MVASLVTDQSLLESHIRSDPVVAAYLATAPPIARVIHVAPKQSPKQHVNNKTHTLINFIAKT